jgi:hypothetical protein
MEFAESAYRMGGMITPMDQRGSGGVMAMPSPSRQNAYYAEQAAKCAAAALITTIAEIKQAYLDLEQGWRQLIPESADRAGAPRIDLRRVKNERK